jgi:hypothetical protein
MHRKSRARVWPLVKNRLFSNAWFDFWSPVRLRRQRRGMILLYGSTAIPVITEYFQSVDMHVFAIQPKPNKKGRGKLPRPFSHSTHQAS